MPLASLATLQWYGPAAGSATITVSPSSGGAIRGRSRATATVSASAVIPLAKPTRLKGLATTIVGQATVTSANPKGRARMSADIRVNELTQDDVTGAVLEAPVESGVSLKEALRLLLSVAVGKTGIDVSGPSPIVTFRDLADTKNRITATMDESTRVSVSVDPT